MIPRYLFSARVKLLGGTTASPRAAPPHQTITMLWLPMYYQFYLFYVHTGQILSFEMKRGVNSAIVWSIICLYIA